jgi:methionyl aminopeptidase
VAGIGAVRDEIPLGAIGDAIETLRSKRRLHRRYRSRRSRHRQTNAHSSPHPYHRIPGPSIRLRAGMAFTIEPMINLGAPDVVTLDDGWTIATEDGSFSAQFGLFGYSSGCSGSRLGA